MGALIYSSIASLDGYVNDADGGFAWAEPRPAVHRFITEREGRVRTYLYGRRMYEVMRAWEQTWALAEEFAFIRDFQEMWRAADKVVYSTTLESAETRRTRVEVGFDPVVVAAQVSAADHDVSIGGPTLARHALLAGIVDEVQVYTVPVAVGGGTHFLPCGFHARLDLREEHRFADGTVFTRYSVRR
ncbi:MULTISPECIES: dihydrofolate reductase family protein [unclassified Rathayibacter]|uniref:dihydrofolate reductase family protein n=1 Tax=unclassified Rathayibacter TaxID=2609250 RepID=UPI000CE7B930|nr:MULTISPECIES: dihydrofolate reductase family protein [unclassified Rathayibacter]PPF53834.1 deaminase [Rathayibacter sp. AY1C2]PPG14318.1 deaminase [Rathayibacter sp. AY1C6]PPH95086.1 deaminase [Rathayibacter sp. AY1D5]